MGAGCRWLPTLRHQVRKRFDFRAMPSRVESTCGVTYALLMIGSRWPQTVLLLALTAFLAGCSSVLSSPQSAHARHIVGDVVKSASSDRHDDINGFARSTVAKISGDGAVRDVVSLVGIEELEPSALGDPLGVLTFRVQLAATQNGFGSEAAFDACFGIEFNYYGVTDDRIWEGVNYLRESACPVDVGPVVPPIDTSVVYVVAANAEDVAMRVLSEVTSVTELDGSDIEARILALLDVPSGEFEELTPPSVVVVDGKVGVAMGNTAHNCVLVALVGGVVSRVMPAPVRLEPGELGCRPETALMDPKYLGSPH